jgi:hypothetical protein
LQIARKFAISLLACVLAFTGLCVFAFTDLFNIIEARFYNRAVLNGLESELASYTNFVDGYVDELQKRFSDILSEKAVKNSFWIDQNREDIYERGRIFASLGISLPGLQWVRFVDATGNRIHYSTNQDDQILNSAGMVIYKNYYETAGYIPFDQQMISGAEMRRIVFDEDGERLIFYYPFYDSMDVRRGEAMFAVSIRSFREHITQSARKKMIDDISVISDPAGIVIGVPAMETASLKKEIAYVWALEGTAMSRLYIPGHSTLALLSSKTSQNIFVGFVVPENLFSFPDALKALLTASVFITLFVVFFLVANIKQDSVAVVQGRLKELQVSLMHEYYQLMGDMDWAVWRRELEQRREDVKNELCRGIKIKKGGDIEEYINSFFHKSWDGLLAAIGSRTGMITTFDEGKLEAILNRVLSSVKSSGIPGDDYEFQTARPSDDDIEEFENADEEVLSYDIFDNTGGAPNPVRVYLAENAAAVGAANGGGGADSADPEEFEELSGLELPGTSASDQEPGNPDTPNVPEAPNIPENLEEDEAESPRRTHSGAPLCVYSPRKLYNEHSRAAGELSGSQDKPEQNAPVSQDFSYGEFIYGSSDDGAEKEKPALSAGPMYDVDEFPEPDEDGSGLKITSPKAMFRGGEARESVIKNRNGINYINTAALNKSDGDKDGIDPKMKNLVESVLGKPRQA